MATAWADEEDRHRGMSFWPSDTAGQIADVISAVAFIASIGAGVYSKIRGNATDQAVRELRHNFERRDLLPDAAQRYQKLYLEIVPVLSKPTDPHIIAQKIGEFRGIIGSLDAYLDKNESGTIAVIKSRLVQIAQEPTEQSHLQALLGDAASLSVELEIMVKRITWNSQS